MKKYYFLFGMLLLIHLQGMSQQADVYASVYKPYRLQSQSKESNSLKQALSEVENNTFKFPLLTRMSGLKTNECTFQRAHSKAPEQALDSLLKETGLVL